MFRRALVREFTLVGAIGPDAGDGGVRPGPDCTLVTHEVSFAEVVAAAVKAIVVLPLNALASSDSVNTGV
jgi:hypothetical protein